MNARSIVRPTMPRVDINSRVPAQAARDSGWASSPADRAFKVLQPSHAPAQLSLFPSPGQATRLARGR